MGYAHIENLYRAPEVLECFALEKVHGTSAHIAIRRSTATHPVEVLFSAGGAAHAAFVALFDRDRLAEVFAAKFPGPADLVIYGEAFGGKMQGMSATYGKELRFLAFDVRLDDTWLDVPSAAGLVAELGLGFVPYARGPMTLEWLDSQRDADSLVAVGPGKMREGIVIRPIRELQYKTGERFIFKHKREEFRETRTAREVDPASALAVSGARAIADEYVTPMRLEHVLQRVPFVSDADTGAVVRAMQEDVERESSGEVEWSKEVARAVGRATVRLLHDPRRGATHAEGMPIQADGG